MRRVRERQLKAARQTTRRWEKRRRQWTRALKAYRREATREAAWRTVLAAAPVEGQA